MLNKDQDGTNESEPHQQVRAENETGHYNQIPTAHVQIGNENAQYSHVPLSEPKTIHKEENMKPIGDIDSHNININAIPEENPKKDNEV